MDYGYLSVTQALSGWRLNNRFREQARSHILECISLWERACSRSGQNTHLDFRQAKRNPVQRKSHRVFCCQPTADVVDPPSTLNSVSAAFQRQSHALTAADAQGRQTFLRIALEHFVQQCHQYPAA